MESKKIKWIILIINNLVILGLLLFVTIDKCNTLSANDIFRKNMDFVVEVKASTDDIGESYGTGIIYDNEGLIITNAHVISYIKLSETKIFDSFEIRFITKEDFQIANLLKYDIELDLAILKTEDNSIKYNNIDFSKKECSYGDKVYAIGNTSNYDWN